MSSDMRHESRAIGAFLILLCLFSAVAYGLIIHIHKETAMLSRLIMWCPGSAALVTCALFDVPRSTLGWRWPKARWLGLSYVMPVLYALPVYVLTWFVLKGSLALKEFETSVAAQYGFGGHPALATGLVGVPLLVTFGVLSTCTWALGEELGWRGFLFPRLRVRMGFAAASLVSGVIWAAWHYPGLLWADYNAGTNPIFAMTCFTVSVVGLAFISGWLRVRTDSLWPCVVLHASHNLFVEGVFDPLTVKVGLSRFVTSEFGLGLSLTICVAAAVLLRRQPVASRPAIGLTANSFTP